MTEPICEQTMLTKMAEMQRTIDHLKKEGLGLWDRHLDIVDKMMDIHIKNKKLLDEAKEMAWFYGNEENWLDYNTMEHDLADFENVKYANRTVELGGAKARAFIKKLEGEK